MGLVETLLVLIFDSQGGPFGINALAKGLGQAPAAAGASGLVREPPARLSA